MFLTAAAVAELLDVTERQVRERLACRPDFPEAIRKPGVGVRWDRDEVVAWMRAPGAGRPRQSKRSATEETSGA